MNFIKPIVSSKILRPIGIDADYTDLSPINPILFKKLKQFDLIHTTDQLFTMAKTALKVSKTCQIPLTSSFHTDTPAYSEYYVKKIFNYFPKIFSNFFLKKIKIHQKVRKNQEKKIEKYMKNSKRIMINKTFLNKDFLKNINSNNIINLERGIDKNIFRKKKS